MPRQDNAATEMQHPEKIFSVVRTEQLACERFVVGQIAFQSSSGGGTVSSAVRSWACFFCCYDVEK
jgi:hypothetical protein